MAVLSMPRQYPSLVFAGITGRLLSPKLFYLWTNNNYLKIPIYLRGNGEGDAKAQRFGAKGFANNNEFWKRGAAPV